MEWVIFTLAPLIFNKQVSRFLDESKVVVVEKEDTTIPREEANTMAPLLKEENEWLESSGE